VLDLGGEPLTRNLDIVPEDIVGQWKEHFKDLFNPASITSTEEAEWNKMY